MTRDEWTAALRSGKYKQTRGSIKTPDGFCCLGVGQELLGWTEREDVADIFEWCKNSFNFSAGNVSAKLIDMNDVQGKSFLEIADYLDSLSLR